VPADPRTLELSERYHGQLDELVRRAATSVGRTFAGVPLEDLGAGYREAIAAALTVIQIGQTAAVSLSRGYVRAAGRLEVGEAAIGAPAESNVGETADHRPLVAALAATPARVFVLLKKGRPIDQAVRFGAFSSSRVAETEIMDAARIELEQQIREQPAIRGWRWRSRGTCAACMSLDDGAVRGSGQPLRGHPKCRCVQEPVFDVEETVTRESGHERFRALSPSEQDQNFGQERADLLRSGRIAWADLVAREGAHEWRDALVTRPLAELLARARGD
jgi:hypothetical protein